MSNTSGNCMITAMRYLSKTFPDKYKLENHKVENEIELVLYERGDCEKWSRVNSYKGNAKEIQKILDPREWWL